MEKPVLNFEISYNTNWQVFWLARHSLPLSREFNDDAGRDLDSLSKLPK